MHRSSKNTPKHIEIPRDTLLTFSKDNFYVMNYAFLFYFLLEEKSKKWLKKIVVLDPKY